MGDMTTLDVDKVVVPILDRESGVIGPRPLGTGFFVGTDPVLVTCHNCMKVEIAR